MTSERAIPECCAQAVVDGLAVEHAAVCPLREEPQPEALFDLPEPPSRRPREMY